MESAIFIEYAQQCAPLVHPTTMRLLVEGESSFNPFAIAVVGGRLERQPSNLAEAVATVRWLVANKKRFAAGIAQIYVGNFDRFGFDAVTVFDVCKNLSAGSQLLAECQERAMRWGASGQAAIEKAFSCYYSNNFTTGFKDGYVQALVSRAYKAQIRAGLAR